VIETREFRGWWWLPGERDDRLPGALVVTKGEAELDLTGHFGHDIISETDTERVPSGHLADQPRILGIDSNGKSVTSVGHSSASYSLHSAGVVLSKYARQVTLVGKHFDAGQTIAFDEISIQTSDLTAWTQVRAIQTKAKTRKHRRGYHVWSDISVRWKPLDDIEIPLSRGERAFIRFGMKFQGIDIAGRGSDHAELTQDTDLHLRFTKSQTLEQVFNRVGDLRNFLSLAVGRPVAVLSVAGFRDDFADETTKLPIPIEILWGIPHNPDPPEKPREAHEMLFTLPEVSTEISKVMRSWFAKRKRLEPVFNLFFGLLYHPDIYSDVRFLLYAQAVETYGYRRGRKPVERNFGDQIRDVLATCPIASRKIVGADTEAFVKLLTMSRHYYTHYNPNKEKASAHGVGLFVLSHQLRTLIEMALLRELGFTPRATDAILARARRYEQIEHFRAYA
jgi:hypothetical protein